jgi:hypothetical protein
MKLNLISLLSLRFGKKIKGIMRLQSSKMWRSAVWYIHTNIFGGICCYIQYTPERHILEDWILNVRLCKNLICHKGNCVPCNKLNCTRSMPITVGAEAKAWTVFAHSNTGILGSNSTRGMDVCVRLLCVCVLLRSGSGLVTGWSPLQGVLPTV